ncbi:unnamed protein product [Blepharisma stoltei]|uniref:Importin subunit alpha n=1 Tax=Blepharisma stoltei TaxID=1481888 RepID=A0AAU9ITF3_9CILI|nr:unnamed protein product [Blepharisma stoltei]
MDITSVQSRFEDRIYGFQQVAGTDLLKKKQENYAVELRKKIRSQNTTKRRAVASGYSFLIHYSEKENVLVSNLPFHLIKMNPELASLNVKPVDKLKIIHEIMTEDTDTNVLDQGLGVLVAALAIDEDIPFNTIVSLNFIPILQRLMDYKYPSTIVYNAAVCLANLCTGPHEYTSDVFQAEGLQSFLKIISPRNIQTSSVAIRGIANLCGDCYEYAKAIISSPVIAQISQLLESTREDNFDLLGVLSQLVRNITHYADEIPIEQIDIILQWIGKMIFFQDPVMKEDCLEALRHISRCEDSSKIELVLENNLGGFCVQSLTLSEENLVKNAVKIVANFLALDKKTTQQLLDCGVLDKLLLLIEHPNAEMRKTVYLALDNIVCGSKSERNQYLNHEIAALSMRGLHDIDAQVKYECSLMISNFIILSSHTSILKLIDLKIFDYLKGALNSEFEPDFLSVVLIICSGLLEAGKAEQDRVHDVSNQVTILFEETGCLDELENLIGNIPIGDNFVTAQQIHEEFFGQLCDIVETKIEETPTIFEFS